MKKSLMSILILIISSIPALAGVQQLFDSANRYYSENEFQRATELYEEIIAEGVSSPELYFNLGNAYYRSNSLSKAILNYERALKLAPGDTDILFNLEIARAHLTDRIEEIPKFFLYKWVDFLASVYSSDGWAWLSIGLLLMFLVAAALFIFSRSVDLRKIMLVAGIFFLLLTLIAGALSRKQMKIILDSSHAIIVSPMVVIKSSPDDNSTDLFILHEGTKVTLGEELGGWREIRIADGKNGWTRNQHFEVI
jgi:tetratricopeptide (TPR) repeat protein